MEEKVIIGKVAGCEAPPGSSEGTLRLADGSRFTLLRSDKRFDFWLGLLKDKQDSGTPIYVQADPATGAVRRILVVLPKRIESVGNAPEGDRLSVAILREPSMYFLRTTRADYAEWRDRLKDAQQTHAPLPLVVEPDSKEILHVGKP
ncbi:MAG TPA: hypothetical protein VN461_17845 [Vicinamibacteria bacterium]|jgi:hypothetical protein|nr:hypothetical protein [Vicinamibacteria bacterium]